MSESDNAQMEKKPLLSLRKSSVIRPLLASFLASIMSFASGTVVGGWTPPEKPVYAGDHLFVMKNMENSSLVVSIYVFGALVGALPAGQISKSLGRKRFLLMLALPMILGWLLIMFFVNEVFLIYVGRLLCGLSLGAVTVAVPLYSCDVAPNVCRGRSGVFLDFMLCAGILYSYVVSSVAGLRVFSFTCSLIPVVFGVLFAFMPESPQHLYAEKRYVDAKAALTWLHGEDFDVKEEFDKFARQQNEDDYESSSDGFPSKDSCKDQDKRRTFRKAVVLSVALATIQRMSGAGAIVQFTAKLFKISGSSVQPITASIITGVVQLVGSGVAIVLVDRVGRRKLLLVSSVVVVKCLVALTAYFYYLNKGTLAESLKILPIVVVCAHISFFRLGLGPIPWFMTSELLGDDHQNRAQSFVASYSWILSFVVMQSFIPLVNNWPVALWFGYSALSALGLLFVLFFVPETNNKSVEQIRLSLMKTSQLIESK